MVRDDRRAKAEKPAGNAKKATTRGEKGQMYKISKQVCGKYQASCLEEKQKVDNNDIPNTDSFVSLGSIITTDGGRKYKEHSEKAQQSINQDEEHLKVFITVQLQTQTEILQQLCSLSAPVWG